MKALLVLGTVLIIAQIAVLIALHRRRQRFRQERERFLAEFDRLEEKRGSPTRNE